MSLSLTQVEQLCLDIQGRINQPECLHNFNTGFLDAIQSQRNSRMFTILNAGAGVDGPKARPLSSTDPNACKTVKLKANAPICKDVSRVQETCDTNICEQTGPYQDREREFELSIDNCLSLGGHLSEDEFDCVCRDPESAFNEEIFRAAADIKYALNKKAIQSAYASVGAYDKAGTIPSTGGTTITLPIYSSAGDIQVAAFAKLKQIYRKLSVSCELMSIGGEQGQMFLDVYDAKTQDPCCDTARSFSGVTFQYDEDLDDCVNTLNGTTGESYAFTLPVGLFGLVTYNEYLGYKRKRYEDMTKQVLSANGLNYDFAWYYDKCDEVWRWQLKLHYAFCCYPNELLCNETSPKLLWALGCGDTDCTFFKC